MHNFINQGIIISSINLSLSLVLVFLLGGKHSRENRVDLPSKEFHQSRRPFRQVFLSRRTTQAKSQENLSDFPDIEFVSREVYRQFTIKKQLHSSAFASTNVSKWLLFSRRRKLHVYFCSVLLHFYICCRYRACHAIDN